MGMTIDCSVSSKMIRIKSPRKGFGVFKEDKMKKKFSVLIYLIEKL